MAELVQQSRHPVVVLHHVGQDANVAAPVDIGAKGMRAFACLLIQIAPGDDVVDRKTDAGVKIATQLRQVRLTKGLVDVGGEDGGRLLEERILVMPRPQLIDWSVAGGRQFGVDFRLGLTERLAGEIVQFVK